MGERKGAMNKETQSIVTGLLGGLLVSITVSGRYTDYVKPGFKPMLLSAGIVLIAVGVISLVLALRADSKAHALATAEGDGPADDAHDDDVAHAGHQHSTRAPWLVMLPVLVLLFVAPPALGSDTLTRGITCGTPPPDGTLCEPPDRAMAPLPAGPVDLTMTEFIGAVAVRRRLLDGEHRRAGGRLRRPDQVRRRRLQPGPAEDLLLRRRRDRPAGAHRRAAAVPGRHLGDRDDPRGQGHRRPGNNYVPLAPPS